MQFADSELQLGADPAQLTLCLTLGTNAEHISSCAKLRQVVIAANFIILKLSSMARVVKNMMTSERAS